MIYNILDFGADPHGNTVCTDSIQKTIDTCYQTGGGKITVPAGTYLTGTVYIKSNCCLELAAGATLLGSTNIKDYGFSDYPSCWGNIGTSTSADCNSFGKQLCGLIIADNASHFSITGDGIIDGQGQHGKHFPNKDDINQTRPFLLLFYNCTDFSLRDVSLINPGVYAHLAIYCRREKISNITINSWYSQNGDGLDFDGCSDVSITNCILETGDDSISLKTINKDEPCRNFVISNCIMRSIWAGVRMGTEAAADMIDITITGCVFENCNDGIKLQCNGNSKYENIAVSCVTMRDVHRPIFLSANHFRMSQTEKSIRPGPGTIRNISFSNMQIITSPSGIGFKENSFNIVGLPYNFIENITISDVTATFCGGGSEAQRTNVQVPELLDYTELYAEAPHFRQAYPSAGLYLRNIKGLRIMNCSFSTKLKDFRPMLYLENVNNASVVGVHSENSSSLGIATGSKNIASFACSHNGIEQGLLPLEPNLEKKAEDFRQISKQVADKMAIWAKDVDEAEILPLINKIQVNQLKLDKNSGIYTFRITVPLNGYVYFPFVCGNFRLFANDNLIGQYEVPKIYSFVFKFATCLKEFEGQSVILSVKFDDIDGKGGLVAKMPFGNDYTPKPNGIMYWVEIRGN
jgi:polygalacturonase